MGVLWGLAEGKGKEGKEGKRERRGKEEAEDRMVLGILEYTFCRYLYE